MFFQKPARVIITAGVAPSVTALRAAPPPPRGEDLRHPIPPPLGEVDRRAAARRRGPERDQQPRPTVTMTLVSPQQFQPLVRFSLRLPRQGFPAPYNHSRSRRLEGSLGLRPCGGGSGWNGSGGATPPRRRRHMVRRWRVEGDTRPDSGQGSQTLPTRRRLMGLGDKTATARRPELAGQPTARGVKPSSKRYSKHKPPGEGPAPRPALHELRSESARTIRPVLKGAVDGPPQTPSPQTRSWPAAGEKAQSRGTGGRRTSARATQVQL
ncbi:hypothetical protein GGR11_000220 [Brevundimonas mediterranea]|uniref:Uncharacterized protein n=1 Tax=Brevundimonas mediterranea TaxID=74329 RepID=A0A7W6A009_9CAUL|nr:hypothetical protein [Brevundimonas mediterranea]